MRKFLDKLHPHFDKGGKYERMYPLYEAADTFLYTPGEVTKGESHVRDALDLKRIMITVVLALGPCMLFGCWNAGYQANLAIASGGAAPIESWRDTIFSGWLGMQYNPGSFWANFIHGALWFFPVYIAVVAVGGLCEAIFSIVRGHEINEGFLVTSALFPLTLPPTIPLWQAALGIIFGVVIGKEVFGGTGRNFLNPALTSRAFLYFAYPAFIVGTQVGNTGTGVWVAANFVDGKASATTLGSAAAHKGAAGEGGFTWESVGADATMMGQNSAGDVISQPVGWLDAFIGWIPGSMGETSTLCCLLGLGLLIFCGIASWRIVVSVFAGAYLFALLLNATGSSTNPVYAIPAHWHLVLGGLAFGAVFMATDPVSASMTRVGQYFYGALIGVMTILIRVVNPAFPEGIMLAILFGNVFAPLIDYYVVQGNIKRRLRRTA